MTKTYSFISRDMRRIIVGVAIECGIEFKSDKVKESINIFGDAEKVQKAVEKIKIEYGISG